MLKSRVQNPQFGHFGLKFKRKWALSPLRALNVLKWTASHLGIWRFEPVTVGFQIAFLLPSETRVDSTQPFRYNDTEGVISQTLVSVVRGRAQKQRDKLKLSIDRLSATSFVGTLYGRWLRS